MFGHERGERCGFYKTTDYSLTFGNTYKLNADYIYLFILTPTSWSSGQSLCLLIMRSRVRFLVLPWEFSLKGGGDSRGDHGLGRLVEFRFKGPPGTTSSYITTHISGTT